MFSALVDFGGLFYLANYCFDGALAMGHWTWRIIMTEQSRILSYLLLVPYFTLAGTPRDAVPGNSENATLGLYWKGPAASVSLQPT
jgi:hypothetical protein